MLTMASQKMPFARSPNFDLDAIAYNFVHGFSLGIEGKMTNKKISNDLKPYHRNTHDLPGKPLKKLQDEYPYAKKYELSEMEEQDKRGDINVFDAMAKRFRFKFPQHPLLLLAEMMEKGIYPCVFGKRYKAEPEYVSFIKDGIHTWTIKRLETNKHETLYFWDSNLYEYKISPDTIIVKQFPDGNKQSKRVKVDFPNIIFDQGFSELSPKGKIVNIRIILNYRQKNLYEINNMNDFPTRVALECKVIVPSHINNYKRINITMRNFHKYGFANNFVIKVFYNFKYKEKNNGAFLVDSNERTNGPFRIKFDITNWNVKNNGWNILRYIEKELLNITPDDPKKYKDRFGATIDISNDLYSDGYSKENAKKSFQINPKILMQFQQGPNQIYRTPERNARLRPFYRFELFPVKPSV